MPPRLIRVEVENFKSYGGHYVIAPSKPFIAVIGPNGSGKSNFMDAISFVMGEKTRSLRVRSLSGLIHGASIGRPASQSASVTAVFSLEEGNDKEISFQRSVRGSSSEYRINNNVLSQQEYLAELDELKINTKAKNFLVYQGQAESVATKNPKEMTVFFEEITGSGALKEEYEQLKQQMLKAYDDLNCAHQKKKAFNAERKEAQMEKEEANRYARLKDDLNDKLMEYQLFKLFHNEREMKNFAEDLKSKQHEVEKIQDKKEKVEQLLKEKRKEQGRLGREMAKIEQDIREMVVKISKKKPEFIKVKERVSHTQKKLDAALKTLEQAKKADEEHNNDIQKLLKELEEVERARDEWEASVAGESQSQGRDLHLEDKQVQEYYRLKEEAAKSSARYMQELDSVNREQNAEQDRLDNVCRLRTEAENRHRQKCHEKEEMQNRIGKLAEHIRTSEQALVEQQHLREDLNSDVVFSKNRVQEIQKQFDDVLEQLGDAKIDKHEETRRKKKQEIVERFKSCFPGVYDRMLNMCQPSHKRYNVAVTKVMGRYMEAIVVDTEHTARRCIKYLKEQMLEPETFLPLNYLRTKPINEQLRNITEPTGVKLLFDVLHFEPPAISRAVVFAINNTLVCETPEDAMAVAYDIGERYDAVALDGTFYKKSGIISGGNLDLARKAKRWDEKHMSQLKAQKEKLIDELGEVMKKSRKESELNTVDYQIGGLETRLRYAKTDMENTARQLATIEEEIAELAKTISTYGPQIAKIEKTMQIRERRIKEIKLQMNTVEDRVFKRFCKQIGVKNIRQYENSELRAQEERKEKRFEFQQQIDRITSNLEFERNRDTKSNISRWERTVSDEVERLESCKKQEQKQKEEMDRDLIKLEELKAECRSKKQECDNIEVEVGKAKREVKQIAEEIQTTQKQLMSIEAKIESKKSERHNILIRCKMDNFEIPMLVGNMEDIVRQESTQTSSGDVSSTAQQLEREARISINYDQLSDRLKRLKEEDEIKKTAGKLLNSVEKLENTLANIQAPNMKALQKLEQAQEKLQSINKELETLNKQSRKARSSFEEVKRQRYDRFTKCLDHVSNEIDNIYKSLTQSNAAQAFLGIENLEEPYLDGICFSCVAPGKRFQSMSSMSGGEKTVAALALLFAIHSFQPSPFFVLDEIDCALDNINIHKVARYIKEKAESLQTIVISLKEEFSSYADSVIGIYSDIVSDCLVSQVRSLELSAIFP